MKKRDWVIIVGLVFVIWLIDRVTKAWALETITHLQFYGPVGFILHRNPGAILGTFSSLPPLLRVVSLSTSGAFLVFIYFVIQYLLPRKSFVLRAGMSILLGGILGNVTDRIVWGSVVDFVLLGGSRWLSPAFNFADAIQWVGYFMIASSLIRESQKIWPAESERKKLWINPSYQRKYCLVLIFVGLGFAIISGVFSYTFLKVTIDDIVGGPPKLIEQKFLSPFLITYMSICIGFLIMLFLIGRILSHRTAGPLHAFERFLDNIMAGKDSVLRLRQGDEFTHLEESAKKIRKTFIQKGLLKQTNCCEEVSEPKVREALDQSSATEDGKESSEQNNVEVPTIIVKSAGNK